MDIISSDRQCASAEGLSAGCSDVLWVCLRVPWRYSTSVQNKILLFGLSSVLVNIWLKLKTAMKYFLP